MSFVAVNKNGDEYIFPDIPSRDNKYGIWLYETSVESEIVDISIELPKGSIKALTCRDISWDDEPINLFIKGSCKNK